MINANKKTTVTASEKMKTTLGASKQADHLKN